MATEIGKRHLGISMMLTGPWIDKMTRQEGMGEEERRRDQSRRWLACNVGGFFFLLLLHSKELRAEMPADPFFVLCTPF